MKTLIWPVLTVLGVLWLTTHHSRTVSNQTVATSGNQDVVQSIDLGNENQSLVQEVNQELERLRSEANLKVARPADDLTIYRRLSLALHGTIPSLEEIRNFEADKKPNRIERWLDTMLQDARFADYFAERLGRSYVGVETGQFLVFRRDRFLDWLSQELKNNRPYDEIVTDMISGTGVWTGEGEVNFLTSAFANDEFDPDKLTARSVRAFLGQRIDCAQCHDHPFDHWEQGEFEGLAAHFGQVQLSLAGVVDGKKKTHQVIDSLTSEERTVEPAVPFHPEWLGAEGPRRVRLARWMTHPENKRFERATVNRVWGLMFGKPFVVHRPVDDLPDPESDPDTKVLDILGEAFQQNGYDLRQLIQTIVATDAYRMTSVYPMKSFSKNSQVSDSLEEEELQRAKERWAVFPLVRLRPEQVIGSMLQSNNIHTVNQNSHLFIRALRFFRENDFVDEFGDPGVEELQDWSGTISQALLRMNGELSRELSSLNPFFAPGRIAATASTPMQQIETIYLTCLTRRPSLEEMPYFSKRFEEDPADEAVEDLYWALFNSPEFSWNH